MSDRTNPTAERLRSFIERIERLQKEKEAIAADIREVKAEAKGDGFDVGTINAIIKLRKMTAEERAEQEALLDTYMAALGMLADTPLGEAARKRLSRQGNPDGGAGTEGHPAAVQDSDDDGTDIEDQPAAGSVAHPLAGKTADEARAAGRDAALAGTPVTKNPFPAGDPNRAAWDEAWCQAVGSDGMDIPEAWKRTERKKGGREPSAETADDGATS
jgi:uncharacterized protein (UPF0335 family)